MVDLLIGGSYPDYYYVNYRIRLISLIWYVWKGTMLLIAIATAGELRTMPRDASDM